MRQIVKELCCVLPKVRVAKGTLERCIATCGGHWDQGAKDLSFWLALCSK